MPGAASASGGWTLLEAHRGDGAGAPRGDLERLREECPTLEPTVATPEAGYKFRETISHADFAAGMREMASGIGYSNLKDRVHDAQGREREWLYHSVWHVMNEAQEEARQDKRWPEARLIQTGRGTRPWDPRPTGARRSGGNA